MILPIHNAIKFSELCDENKVLICSTYIYVKKCLQWNWHFIESHAEGHVSQVEFFLFYFYVSFFLTHGAWFYNNVQCKLKWRLIWDFFNILNTYITSSSDLLLCISLKWTHLTLAQSHPKGKGTKQWSMKIHGHVCLCCGNSFYLSIQQ